MRQIINIVKDKTHLFPPDRQRGQSVVELAIITPLLLLLLLGMVEVGAVLRNYLVLAAANREAARFASRGRYENDAIAKIAIDTMADQLSVETSGPDANVSVLITTISIHHDSSESPEWEGPTVITGTAGASRIDPAVLSVQLKAQNDSINATLEAREPSAQPSGNQVVIVEIIYQHEQLLNMPIITQFLPNPIPLYTQTMMRVTGDSRFD
jgi:Flp pilus assembly protein TadG